MGQAGEGSENPQPQQVDEQIDYQKKKVIKNGNQSNFKFEIWQEASKKVLLWMKN